MSEVNFERHFSKFEVVNQCLLLTTDKNEKVPMTFEGQKILVRSHGKLYTGNLREFYDKGEFKLGIAFEHEGDHLNDFFFDQGVTENKRVRVHFNPTEGLIEGRNPIDLDVYMVTATKK